MRRQWIGLLLGALGAATAGGQCGPEWTDTFGITGVPWALRAFEFDPDGSGPNPPGTVVIGSFSQVEELRAGGVAFFDGARWSALGAGFDDGAVTGGLVWNGRLVVTGSFTRTGGRGIQQIASWDGTSWTSISPGIGAGSVLDIAVHGGDLIAIGQFTQIGGVPADNVARFDGTAWHAMGGGFNGWVGCAGEFRGDLLVGGPFTMVGGVQTGGVARWNGAGWESLGAAAPSRVITMAEHAGELYVGGEFFGGPANVAKWTGSAWEQVGPIGLRGSAASVRSLLSTPRGLLAAGRFTDGGGEVLMNVARLEGAAWRAFGGVVTEPNAMMQTPMGLLIAGRLYGTLAGSGLRDLAVYKDEGPWGPGWYPTGTGLSSGASCCTVHQGGLVVGGYFDYAGERYVRGVAKWQDGAWRNIGNANSPAVTPPILGVDVLRDDLYVAVGGGLLKAGVNSWQNVSGDVRGSIAGVRPIDAGLLVYGSFTRIGGVDTSRVALYDGTTWTGFGNSLVGGAVQAACEFNGRLVVGGSLTSASGRPLRGAASWDGSAWRPLGTLNTGLESGQIVSLEAFDGKLYAGGNFSVIGFPGRRFFAAWDGIRWTPAPPVGPVDGVVNTLKVYRDALLMSGSFTTAGGRTVPGVCLWDGREIRPFADGSTFEVADWCEFDGKDWFVGGCREVGGRTSRHVAALRESSPYIIEPERFTVTCPGGAFDLHCVPSDPGLSYRWMRDGVLLTDGLTEWGSVVSGSAGPVLTVEGAGRADAGEYICRVDAACGTSSSLPARVRVCKVDRNCDGGLDFFDYVDFVEAYESGAGSADFNEDGFVDFFDSIGFVDAFEAGCQ